MVDYWETRNDRKNQTTTYFYYQLIMIPNPYTIVSPNMVSVWTPVPDDFFKQQYIDYIEKTVREHCKELEHKTHNSTHHRYDYTYDEIHLEHILRTMGDKYILWFDGLFMQMTWTIQQEGQFWEYCYTPVREIINERIDFIQFDLSLSWKDQDISFLKFCAETMGFNQ